MQRERPEISNTAYLSPVRLTSPCNTISMAVYRDAAQHIYVVLRRHRST